MADVEPEASLARRTRWESATTIPLVVLGIGFIVSYSLYVLVETMPQWLLTVILLELAITWIVFLVDYVARVVLTPSGQRGAFVRHNPVDLLSVLLPVFRAFRVINLLRNIPYFHSRTGAAVRAEVITCAAAYAVLFIYFMALATLSAERDVPDATINSFGQAIWWACVTLATVGYGDTYPVTVLGRVYAVLLMAGGVAIIGTASALVLSYITEQVQSRVRKP